MKNVMAVIITYNIGEEFKKNIEELKGQVNEIVVVDNGSKIETIDVLESISKHITIIRLQENMGIAYALNKGIEYGVYNGYKWILTLDHDSIAKVDMVTNMLNEYESIEDKDMVVMLTPVHVEERQVSDYINSVSEGHNYILTEITSGAMVKCSYYKEHTYDEKLFIDLVDHDFCLNINRLGYKIIQANQSILLHNLGESIPKRLLGLKVVCTNHSALRRYYMTRNRLYIWKKYKKHFSGWISRDKIRFLSETIKIAIFEENRLDKIKMIIKGFEDYRHGRWGSFYLHHK